MTRAETRELGDDERGKGKQRDHDAKMRMEMQTDAPIKNDDGKDAGGGRPCKG